MNTMTPTQKQSASGGVLLLYLAHLGVPAVLLLDAVAHWGDAGGLGPILIVIVSLWLVSGLGPLFVFRDRARFLRRAANPLMAIYACYLALLLVELTILVFGLLPETPTMRRPGLKLITDIDPKILPGVQGPARFSINEFGLRSASPSRPGHSYKMITVGGSTTECTYSDDSRAWPHLLMEALNHRQNERRVWVANAGLSGQTAVGHLMLVQTLPILQHADLLIFQTGANDLMTSLAFEGASTQQTLEREAAGFRQAILLSGSRPRYPLFKRLGVYTLVRRAADQVVASSRFQLSQRYKPVDYEEFRRERASAPTVPPPDLRTSLEEYGQRIVRLEQECRTRGIRCLFVTQPSLWRRGLGEAERALLWFGWVGRRPTPKGYINVSDASAAIASFNQKLLETCREKAMECFDLAPLVPKDTSAFYDDFHFNDGGSQVVADRIAGYLLSVPPFGPEASRTSQARPSP